MNRFSILSGILLLCGNMYAQSLLKKNYPSQFVPDSVPVKIWLPEHYSPEKKYPVIYEFVYDHSNYIAATLQNYYNMPECIVVCPYFAEAGNAHYSNPELNEKGKTYYSFLVKELIPAIEKNYHTTDYRVATGLSQGADYVNYILRNNPELFKAWLIFSIEKPVYQPDFSTYTRNLKQPADYFIAVANDNTQRMSFARSLDSALKTDSQFNIRIQDYPGAEHAYSLIYAFPDALKFIFNSYINLRTATDTEDALTYYKHIRGETNQKYGIEPEFNALLSQVMNTLKNTKDAAMVQELVDSLSPRCSQLQLFNMAYSLAGYGYYTIAEQLLFRAEQLMPSLKKDMQLNPVMIYRTLALNIYDKQEEYEKAFNTLKTGHEKISRYDVGLLYYIGSYSLKRNIHLEEGVNAIREVLSQRDLSIFSVFNKDEKLYTQLADAYSRLKRKKEARYYAELALKINPGNTEVQAILKKL